MQPENNSFFNFGDLSKPVNTLIEKISDATGTLFYPIQIKRIAKAEAEADKIKALSIAETAKAIGIPEEEIKELQKRALYRFIGEETIKQNNIEQITQKSFQDVKENAQPEKMDNDWIMNFFDNCKIVSDDEMQAIWAKVLAGEANNPGSFSKRTVNVLSTLDKLDALLFEKLCSFSWFLFVPTILIYNTEDKIYSDDNINFSTLLHLDEIGLINFEKITGFMRREVPKNVFTSYFTTPIEVIFNKDSKNEIAIGQVVLTKIGAELMQIVNAKPKPEFIDYVLKKWFDSGICTYSRYPKFEVTTNVEYYFFGYKPQN